MYIIENDWDVNEGRFRMGDHNESLRVVWSRKDKYEKKRYLGRCRLVALGSDEENEIKEKNKDANI